MGRLHLFLFLAVVQPVCLLTCGNSYSGRANKYVVRRATTGGTCQVWDSQASPIGTVVVGGPFNSRLEATSRMCELRTNEPADMSKCFDVNPKDACDTAASGNALDLPDAMIRYLDTLSLAKVNIDETVLPNGKKFGPYKRTLLDRSKRGPYEHLIFQADTPQEQLSQLFVNFFSTAADLVDHSKHQYPKGADKNEPEQDGLGYNYGSRDYANRKKMYAAACQLKVYALDCSGLLFQVFNQSGCNNMNITAVEQGKLSNLNAAISGVVTGVEAKDKGKLNSADIITGDIVYWDKLAGASASHIGIVLKAGDGLYVFQSNGSQTDCEGNLSPKRGPRTLQLDDAYWFAANCNWKVLRYEVK
jgi:hypothetical protein